MTGFPQTLPSKAANPCETRSSPTGRRTLGFQHDGSPAPRVESWRVASTAALFAVVGLCDSLDVLFDSRGSSRRSAVALTYGGDGTTRNVLDARIARKLTVSPPRKCQCIDADWQSSTPAQTDARTKSCGRNENRRHGRAARTSSGHSK